MKLSGYAAVLLYSSTFVLSFNPFKGISHEASKQNGQVQVNLDFNAHELLESKSRKPEIYTKAMLELKRLEEEPICHRVAVQLLMNNCQGLENAGESEYQFESAHLQRHHIESFAASLAICDLERGGFVIPTSCQPFTSSSLMRASRDQKGSLHVSPDQVGSCLGALGQDHSHWMTWLSYRDKALLFCRAARFDIDKDQAILHHKKLTQIMTEFTEGLDEDLRNIKQNMEGHARAAESYFAGVKSHADNLKSKLQDSVELVSKDFKEAASSIKISLGSTVDLQRMLKNLVQTVIQSTAEVAAHQDQALSVTTNRAKSEIEELSVLAGETGATIAELKESIRLLFPAIVSLGERQDSLDKRSETLYRAMANMTTLLYNHTESLEQASSTAFGIHHSLEQAAYAAKSWNQTLSLGSALMDYGLRVSCPIASVFLGNYGLPPSLTRNAALVLGGYGLAESIVQFRHLAFTQYTREWLWAPTPLATMRRFPLSSSDIPGVDFTMSELGDNLEDSENS